MRQIVKAGPPNELIWWTQQSKATGGARYDDMPADVRRPLLAHLIAEQGEICAYTGRRIDVGSAHIEHLKAQTHCQPGEDIDYRNVVACYPAPNTDSCPYGAHAKGSWPSLPEADHFVSPLSAGCERRFTFAFSGKVRATSDTDTTAQQTIERLALDHDELVALRRAAIRNTVAPRDRPLTKPQALRVLAKLQAQAGQREEFHFALVQQLQRHATAQGQ